MTIQWQGDTPTHIAQAAQAWLGTIETTVGRKAVKVGQDAENRMRESATWRNQTGNARRGLRVVVTEQKPTITMTFVHSVEYGKHLELSHGGKYAVVYPTLLDTVPILRNELRGVANG